MTRSFARFNSHLRQKIQEYKFSNDGGISLEGRSHFDSWVKNNTVTYKIVEDEWQIHASKITL